MQAGTYGAGLVAAALAPFVGSFLGLVVVRLPRGEGMVLGRSSCRSCGHALAPPDLVPLATWLVLGGRCRRCRAPIGRLYPAMELAALAVALWAASVVSGWALLAACGLGWTLLALAAIDLRETILPDVLTLPLLAAGLLFTHLAFPERLLDHALGAAAGYLLLAALAAGYRAVRGREGLGLGDAKLLAAAGAWTSWTALPSVVLLAALSGLAGALVLRASGRGGGGAEPIPFGPFLALATWAVWLHGPLVLP